MPWIGKKISARVQHYEPRTMGRVVQVCSNSTSSIAGTGAVDKTVQVCVGLNDHMIKL